MDEKTYNEMCDSMVSKEMEAFYCAIEPIMWQYQFPIVPFVHNKETGEYFSYEDVLINGTEYTILVKKDGAVVYGIITGPDFQEFGSLGKIDLEGLKPPIE